MRGRLVLGKILITTARIQLQKLMKFLQKNPDENELVVGKMTLA